MRIKHICILTLFTLLSVADAFAGNNRLDEVLSELDRTIAQSELYRSIREENIGHLRQISQSIPDGTIQRYNINAMLADAYSAYQLDSTLSYLTANLAIAHSINDRHRIDESNLRLAFIYTTSGYYIEASTIFENLIDTTSLNDELLGKYYIMRARFARENTQYTRNAQLRNASAAQNRYYTDRIIEHYPVGSEEYLRALYDRYFSLRDFEHADSITDILLSREQSSSHRYAIYSYMKSETMLERGDNQMGMYYLAHSAIADVQSSIRDNASLALLSNILFHEGNNLDRAFAYIQIASNDARFYNARLRPWQIAAILPAIETAYTNQQQQQMRTILWMTVGISLLLIITGLIAVIEIRQKRRIEQMQQKLQQASLRMEEYIRRLSDINNHQAELNAEIREANAIKEEYIGLFLGICSDYIDKMKEYQRTIRKKLASGSAEKVYKELGSSELIDAYIEEFYTTFDNAFLRLYPNFVQEFNSLLNEDARINLKEGKPLTTELRIFALIRLGINDSSKIAGLLRYSVNTIYNYRAKVKNNACVSREDFEEKIKKIGSFQTE